MAKGKRIISIILLTPLSYVYGAIVYVRNKMFDWGLLKQTKFSIPVVSIGNIAIGGTGKTPHTEYLISILQDRYRIAVLSRGYKRKTTGFILASPNSSPLDIGDEPYQIYHKFGQKIAVAVCENRVIGINRLLAVDPSINLVLLDDAFQHRYVKPTVSIVLTEYNRPFFNDRLLPLGHLRESRQSVWQRADIVIATKCPSEMKPLDFKLFKKHLDLFPSQKLFFSKLQYGTPMPVFPDMAKYTPTLSILNGSDTILAITGIANPTPFVRYLKTFNANVKVMHFPDHHNFSRTDIDDITDAFNSLSGRYKLILTTEKDAVRIAGNPYYPFELRQHTFLQPINVAFIGKLADTFESTLISLIEKK